MLSTAKRGRVQRKRCITMVSAADNILMLINPRYACAAGIIMVVSLCVCVSVYLSVSVTALTATKCCYILHFMVF